MQTLTIKQKRELIRKECARRGIQIAPHGVATRLTAPGVDLLVTDLSWVYPDDLDPHRVRPPLP